MARGDNGGFVAGLVVGGLVGAAAALLYNPRTRRRARAALSEAAGQSPAELLERGREALRTRLQSAADEAQQAATDTETRLGAEYRTAVEGGPASSPRP